MINTIRNFACDIRNGSMIKKL